jgi:hypothetical protein
MLPVSDSDSLKTRVEQLAGKRKPLAAQFEKSPSDTHLALELKIIDDQIAECNQRIQHDRRKQK